MSRSLDALLICDSKQVLCVRLIEAFAGTSGVLVTPGEVFSVR